MNKHLNSYRVAVVGAGLAGSACARALREVGLAVHLFEKSRGVGGRMSTRRVQWTDADGADRQAEFDHGAQAFSARHPRFRAMVRQAVAAGVVTPWQMQVHAPWPAAGRRERFVATPNMPALCRHLAGDSTLHLDSAVQRLQRAASGWQLTLADGSVHGPFAQVVLAMPPAQAALLLAGHHDAWADTLASAAMAPCWTLMAVTDDVDWPWDAVEPAGGPLAWVARNDAKPGRSAPQGCATWVAQASAAWSAAHLEEDPQTVADLLRTALRALLPAGPQVHWHFSSVHRWRYAQPVPGRADPALCWWDAGLGLGVCGDFMAGSNVEAAWRSGDELADTLLAALEPSHDDTDADVAPPGTTPPAAAASLASPRPAAPWHFIPAASEPA